MRKILGAAIIAAMAAGCIICPSSSPSAVAVSADGRNEIRLWVSPLAYEVARDGEIMVAKTPIGMTVDGKNLGIVNPWMSP